MADTTVWELGAQPESIRTVADAWRSLAEAVGESWRELADPVGLTIGSTWSGAAADSYDGHVGGFGGDIDASRLLAVAVAEALDAVAEALVDAQQRLDNRLAELYESVDWPRLPFLDVPLLLSVTEAQRSAVEQAETEAWEIRRQLNDSLWVQQSVFDEASRMFGLMTDRWRPVAGGESTGWAPPPEVTHGIQAIQVDDQLILNLPDSAYPPGETILVHTNPETGETDVVSTRPLEESLLLYRAPAGSRLTLRTGPGADTIQVGAVYRDRRGYTVIAGAGDDIVGGSDARDTILGLAGNDSIAQGGPFGQGGSPPPVRRDWISGGAGDDRIVLNSGGSAGGTVLGGSGDDDIDIEVGLTRVSGGEGDDTLTSHHGGATMDGDAGRDRLVGGSGDPDGYSATGYGADVLRGGSDRDQFNADGGNDRVADVLVGGSGHDQGWVDRPDHTSEFEGRLELPEPD